MQISDITAQATARGWHDDSAWTRRSIRRQFSLRRHSHLASVTETTDGTITWSVQALDRTHRTAAGTTHSLPAAFHAGEHALDSLAAVLF